MEAKKKPKSAERPKNRNARLSPETRREMIVSAAAQFFADNGLSGTLRSFAKDVGISPSLVFRYFPTKEHLIKAVYDDFILRQIDFKWLEPLTNSSRPIGTRLREFYRSYSEVANQETWVKIALYSGLASHGFRPYLNSYIESIIMTMAREVVAAQNRVDKEVNEEDVELIWHLHSTLNYALIRKYVHRSAPDLNIQRSIDIGLAHFLNGFDPPLTIQDEGAN